MLLARGLLLTVAVVVCAWFAVGIRQTRDLERATAIVSAASTLNAVQAAHVDSLLDSAAWLNPDKNVAIMRGEVALLQNDPARAQRILAPVTRTEPLNLEAWVLLAQATKGRDPTTFGDAIRNIGRLDPKV